MKLVLVLALKYGLIASGFGADVTLCVTSGDYRSLALGSMIAGVLLLIYRGMVSEFHRLHRPAEDAWRDGYDAGYDRCSSEHDAKVQRAHPKVRHLRDVSHSTLRG